MPASFGLSHAFGVTYLNRQLLLGCSSKRVGAE